MTSMLDSVPSLLPAVFRSRRTSFLYRSQILLISAFLLYSPLTLQALAAPGPLTPLTPADVDRTRTLFDQIKKLRELLDETVMNSAGQEIPKMDHPAKIEVLVGELETLLKATASEPFARPEDAQDLILSALKILYRGRGETTPRDKSGWYPLKKKGANGLAQIEHILSRGLLDGAGKKKFTQFVKSHDFQSEYEKKKAGFTPQFNIGNDSIKDRILNAITTAPEAAPYQERKYLVGGEYSVSELIIRAIKMKLIDQHDASYLAGFLQQLVENNLYDKSIDILNDPDRHFVNYFGRESEARKILDALTKLDKGHILLTGKAGVGKTTILKMLSDSFVQGKMKIRNEAPPIILELPIIVAISYDPSTIKAAVLYASQMSIALNRRIILYIDEAHVSSSITRNALKGFLATMIEPIPENSKVHVIFSTTSEESREFLSDKAFSRRFTEINVPEFNHDQTIQLIKQTYEPIWKRYHNKNSYQFAGISDEAYEYAYRYASHEQPHAGNPTGTKEILEAAIVYKLNSLADSNQGKFNLEASDIQTYIRDHLHISLVPGDPQFENKFQEKWNAFNEQYIGNEGIKESLEEIIRSHFGQMNKNKMTALVNFGPPGGGKSYGAEMIAKHFFDNALLTINGAEFNAGGAASENKLIGSSTGYVGSEEQRSILTKFIKDNPQGGVIKIEEADYLHQDIIRFFTNMITEKKFMDGLGKEWNTSKYILWMNSNIGQELMIPVDARNQMNWEQFNTRRRQATERVIGNGGKEIERIKPELLDEVFEHFIQGIVTQSNPNGDTSAVAQEAQKQKRRYRALYTLPPNREELIQTAHARVNRFIQDTQTEYGVQFEISPADVDRIIDIDQYQFEKGYSYVIDQLEDKLFKNLTAHLHERGHQINVELEEYKTEINGFEIPSFRLVLRNGQDNPTYYSLGAVDRHPKNPWGDSPEMMNRIRNLSAKMYENGIRGNEDIIHRWKALLKLKSSDWNTRVVFTLLGTSGNGKTERFKALAKALYDNENAVFQISGITSKYDLSRFFRPPMGIQGGKEQTELERWFLSRQKSGGGVILLDELLSFSGLSKIEIASRLEAFNELYDLLDEGYVRFGNTRYDARGFVIGITGNALQEAFDRIGDDPDSEPLVEKIKARLGQKEILEYFSDAGMDPPKVARLGVIDVLGPQPRSVTLPVAKAKLAAAIQKIIKEARNPVEIVVDESVLQALIERVTTAKLGMRQVNRAFDEWVKGPLNAIKADFPHAKKIEMKLSSEMKTQWFVDDREVALEGAKYSDTAPEERNWNYVSQFGSNSSSRTPQLEDIPAPKKLKYTAETLHAVAVHELYGHWMTEVLLSRKNPADAISLIAGDNYLGYVRPSEEELYQINDLSRLLQEQIILQAGHRAVFLKGHYATGGGYGGGERDPNSLPSDDIGKIDRIQNTLINNRILPELSEKSTSEQKLLAKHFLNDILDAAADQIITEGIASGEFKPIYNQLIETKFLGKQELDQGVEKINFSHFGSVDEFFIKHIRQAIKTALQHWNQKKPVKNYSILKTLAEGILERLDRETAVRTGSSPSLTLDSGNCSTVFDVLKISRRSRK